MAGLSAGMDFMELPAFLQRLEQSPGAVSFQETIALIDSMYDFTPAAFNNGGVHNAAGQNNGSCKILSFARMHSLPPEQTLHCFGDYYRKDVLGNPGGSDHQNIRNFMQTGWAGVAFEGQALTPKRQA